MKTDKASYSLEFQHEGEGTYGGYILIELSEEIDAHEFEFELEGCTVGELNGSIEIEFTAWRTRPEDIKPHRYD